MKACVVRKRLLANAGFNESGIATTIDLDPGFGIPKAAIVHYTESNQSSDGAFDVSTLFRSSGVGFIGSTDSTITSSLAYRCAYFVQIDGVAATGATVGRRQNQINRWIFTSETQGNTYWQGTSVTFGTDQVTLTTSGSNAPSNNHLDCVFTFFTGDDLNVAVGHTQFPSNAGTTLQLSTLNFQPDVVFVASSLTQSGQGLTDDVRFAYGCATRSPLKQKGIYWHNEGQPTTRVNVSSISSSTLITNYWTLASVGPYFFSLNNFSSSGWAMTAGPSVPNASQNYIYLALQSKSPTDFALVDLITNASTGNSNVGLGVSGFVPSVSIGALTGCTSDNTRATTSPWADGFSLFAGQRSKYSVYYQGAGTLSVTSGTQNVTGVNSEFNRLNQGDTLCTIGGTAIGTISLISSKTGLTLFANAPFTLTSQSYTVLKPNQYYVAVGNSNNATTTQVYSSVGGTMIFAARSSGTVATYFDTGTLQATNSTNSVILNYTQSSGAKYGWMLSVKDSNFSRRRGGIS